MLQKLKNTGFLLMVLVFLLPSIVKFEHHHKVFSCNAKNVKHFHTYHENCEICQFEFSNFKTDNPHLISKDELPTDNYTNQYSSIHSYCFAKFSFSLRAPPFYLI